MFVDADNPSETFAFRAGSDRRVEREHLVVGFFERNAVRLELGAETVQAGSAVRSVKAQQAGSVALVHGSLGGVGKAADGIFLAGSRHAVYQEEYGVAVFVAVLVDTYHFAIHFQAVEALFHVYLQLLLQGAPLAEQYRGEHGVTCAFGLLEHAVHDVLGGMFLYFLSADRAERPSHTGVEQAQVFVYFGGSAYGGTRVTAAYLLLDSDSGGDAFDEVAFGLAHTSQELAGVAAEAFHVAALPFCIKRVECERGFAGAG